MKETNFHMVYHQVVYLGMEVGPKGVPYLDRRLDVWKDYLVS